MKIPVGRWTDHQKGGNMKYRLINYTDVWKNEEYGWEVNNSCVEESELYIDDSCTDKEILSFLKQIGFLSTDDMRKVYLVNYGDLIEIYARKEDFPLGRLEQEW